MRAGGLRHIREAPRNAEFQEEDKGTIAPGQLADLAVLSQDIFTAPVGSLPGTESVMTMVGGEIVYNSGTLAVPR